MGSENEESARNMQLSDTEMEAMIDRTMAMIPKQKRELLTALLIDVLPQNFTMEDLDRELPHARLGELTESDIRAIKIFESKTRTDSEKVLTREEFLAERETRRSARGA